MLGLGLSSAGDTARTSRATAPLTGLDSAGERFVRQGVLPIFGDYALETEIARGGMGIVYRARQRSLNRIVAIKMILAGQLATPRSIERFRLEAQAAARLQHPNIVPIYEIGECETQHYFSMEFVDGASLAECIDEFRLKSDGSALSRRRQEHCIAEMMSQVARALDFAHQRGVLHRDLKPSNILIDENGSPRLTDFGLAKIIDREAGGSTVTTPFLGTPGYLAPEQVVGSEIQITIAVDIYGLGATLYELLTGQPPFTGPTAVATMMMAVEKPPTPLRQLNSGIHRDLETIALRCLEKEPAKRYHSAAAVAEELERFVRGQPIQARPIGRTERLVRWCTRNPLIAAMLAVAVVCILGGSGTALWQWKRADRANIVLRQSIADLKWNAIDAVIEQGQSSRALASLAELIRENPDDPRSAMFAISLMEQRRFPVPAAPPIHHPGAAEMLCARLSPDGRRIITASFDATARLWDAATSTELAPPLQHQGAVNWADFSPDGQWVATGSQDATVRIWDAHDGSPKGEPIHLPAPVLHVEFSPDSRHLLARTGQSICQIDASAGRIVFGPLEHDGPIVAAGFLKHGAVFFTAQQAGEKSAVQIWEVNSGRLQATLATGPLKYADVSEDTRRVVIVNSDNQIWLGNVEAGGNRTAVRVGRGDIFRATFSPTGERIVVIARDHWARVFNASTGEPATDELQHYYILTGASFFDAGARLLTWGNDALARIWDIPGNRPYCEPMMHEHRVVYAEPARNSAEMFLTVASHLANRSAQTHTGAAQLWQVLDRQNPNDRCVSTLKPGFDACVLSNDAKLIALAGYSPTLPPTIRVLDRATLKPMCADLPAKGGVWGLMFTPDGSRLIATTSNGEVCEWAIPAGTRISKPVALSTTIQPAEISPEGRFFATGSTDGMVRLWSVQIGQVIYEMSHGAQIHSLAFSPDGNILASAGADRTICIWSTQSGKLLTRLVGHQNEVMTVMFMPDGRRVVSGSFDFTARIWDLASGKTTAILPHQGEVLDVAVSPDGRYVATASRDRTAVIWDSATGLPQSRPLLHEQAVRNVRFSPDGRWLVTLDFRGLRVWDVATSHPLTVHLPHHMSGGTAFQDNGLRFQIAADGRAVLLGSDSDAIRLWSLTEPPAGAPAWFPDFLESVAQQRFTGDADRPEPVPPERFLFFAAQLRNSKSGDFYTLWARQWLQGVKPAQAPAFDGR